MGRTANERTRTNTQTDTDRHTHTHPHKQTYKHTQTHTQTHLKFESQSVLVLSWVWPASANKIAHMCMLNPQISTCSDMHAWKNVSLCNNTFSPFEVPRAAIAPFFCTLRRSVHVCVFGRLWVFGCFIHDGCVWARETCAEKRSSWKKWLYLSSR